jgi:hypothetical protein
MMHSQLFVVHDALEIVCEAFNVASQSPQTAGISRVRACFETDDVAACLH